MKTGTCVQVDVFGQRLAGQYVRVWLDHSFGETVEWTRVRLDTPTMVGGCGPVQSFVDVAAGCVRQVRCACACHLTPFLKAHHTCEAKG